MSAANFEDLKRHYGHKIVVAIYGKDRKVTQAQNASVECETCCEVLLSFDKEPWETYPEKKEQQKKKKSVKI